MTSKKKKKSRESDRENIMILKMNLELLSLTQDEKAEEILSRDQ